MPTAPPSHRATRPAPIVRPTPAARGYGRAWQRLRASYIRSHPLCVDCLGRGLTTAAAHIDHILPREAGGTDDDSNLQSLCQSCHSRKTATSDGGFGRPRRSP